MLPRRAFLERGLAAAAMGVLSKSMHGALLRSGSADGLGAAQLLRHRNQPILPIVPSAQPTMIGGIPFAPTWYGDVFRNNTMPFHQCESCEPSPAPDEFVKVAIIGGGLSGLSTAWLLRDAKPVLFDLHDRFGGNAMGESWNGAKYSLGSAYFIVADRGSRLDALYQELGVYENSRVDTGPLAFEWNHRLTEDVCAGGCTKEELAAAKAYAERVAYFAYEQYPEIPLPPKNDAWIRELDGGTLHDDILKHCGTLPVALREAVQAYCYSSFGVGWDDISAAAGWNFIAAEEFGRIVLPGGNAGLATQLWRRLNALEQPGEAPRLRSSSLVESVQLEKDRILLRWRDSNGRRRTLAARHVVMANAKQIVERMVDGLDTLDPEKANAIPQVQTSPYLVGNVLLKRPVDAKFYDLFALHDSTFPMDGNAFEKDRRIVDVLDGTFAAQPASSDVLTLYWPLPWSTARFTIVGETDWQTYAEIGAKQIRRSLTDMGIDVDDVVEVRLARWGHAMPVAAPNAIATGIAELVRRPIQDRLWFVNQDNWLLPAVETCLQEAQTWSAEILKRL